MLATSTIDQAVAGFGATRYRAAVSAAAQALAGRHGTIIVVTDLQENGWDPGDRLPVPEGTTVQVVDVGPMTSNLAVTAVRTAPDRIVATLYNAGEKPRDVRAHLAVDGRPSADATTTIAAGQAVDQL